MKKILLLFIVLCSVQYSVLADPMGGLFMDSIFDTMFNFQNFDKNSKTQKDMAENNKYDMGPYMRKLQRQILANWDSTGLKDSDNIIVSFVVLKDGSIDKCQIYKSNNKSYNEKAIEAIMKSAPFTPIPEKYEKDVLNIQAVFSKNIFGVSIL